MTETQKEQIRAMRMQGIGYRLIANELGLKIKEQIREDFLALCRNAKEADDG